MYTTQKTGIKTIREKLGISALDLSKRINVNISVISSWEAGIGIISVIHFKGINENIKYKFRNDFVWSRKEGT